MTQRCAGLRRSAMRAWLGLALVALLVPTAAAAGVRREPARHAGDGTGEVVVGYEAGRLDVATRAVKAKGGTVGATLTGPRALVVSPHAGQNVQDLVAALAGAPGVRYAEEARVVTALFSPDDPAYGAQWNLRRVGAEAAWDVERGDPATVIAIVDSGVDLEHPDLQGRIDTVHDRDFVANDAVADDAFGHGTHVAGIVAAETNNARHVAGLAHGCTLLPVRVLDANGFGDTTMMAVGIVYAADQGAEVINVSAGGPTGTRVLEDACAYAVRKGSVVIAASGNSGSSRLTYPAAYSEVISVGAVDENAQRWPYSCYSAGLDLMAPGITHWSSTAPDDATGITSLIAGKDEYPSGSVGTMYGTSMAAPHASAVAALIRSANPTWTPSLVGFRMMETAEDLGAVGRDTRTGYGLVRADLALGAGTPPTSTLLSDSLPGRPVLSSPVTELVDVQADPFDVYALSINEGQHLRVWLRGPSGGATRFDLLGPDETTLTAAPVVSSLSTGAPVMLEHQVPVGEGGTYSLRVLAQSGGGEYTLAWERGYETEISIDAPSSCAWGGAAYVHGALTSFGGEGVFGAIVSVDEWPAGASGWSLDVASDITGVDGGYSFHLRPKRRTAYRVRFQGSANEFASTSPTVTIRPRPALSAPVPVVSPKRGSAVSIAGSLRPEHRSGAHTVKVYAYRYQSGAWVLRRTTYATNLDRSGYTRYSARVAFPDAGRWKLVAYVPGDSVHTAAYSVPKFVYVR